MNTQLQQLIEDVKDDILQAKESMSMSKLTLDKHYYAGYISACKIHLERLTKILNEGSVAAPSVKRKEPRYTTWRPGDKLA